MIDNCVYIYSKGKFQGHRCTNPIAANSQHFCKQHMKLSMKTKHKTITNSFTTLKPPNKIMNNYSLTSRKVKPVIRRTKSFPSKIYHSEETPSKRPLKNTTALTLAANVMDNKILMSKLSQLNKTGRNYIGTQLASRRALDMAEYIHTMSGVNRLQRQSQKNKIMKSLKYLRDIALMKQSQFKPIRSEWAKGYANHYQTLEKQIWLFGLLPKFRDVLEYFPSIGSHFDYLKKELKIPLYSQYKLSRQYLAIRYLFYGLQQHREKPHDYRSNMHRINTYYSEPTVQELFQSAAAFSESTGFNKQTINTYINLVKMSLKGDDSSLWELYIFFMNNKVFSKRILLKPNIWKTEGYTQQRGGNSSDDYNRDNYVANRISRSDQQLRYISNKINGNVIKSR